jgi:hypothetical protein
LRTVDPDHSSFDLCRHAMSAFQVVSEDRGAEAIGCVVCGVDGFFFGGEAGDYDYRT